MFPFYTPENTRKPKVIWCFQGYKMGTLARNGLNLNNDVSNFKSFSLMLLFFYSCFENFSMTIFFFFISFFDRADGTAWKLSKYGVFSGLYFPPFGLNM